MTIPLVIFDSRTGNVKRFVEKLQLRSIFLRDIEKINEPFVLITYTDKFGQIPATTEEFLNNNHKFLLAVSSSGNRNWNQNYAKSADLISEKFNVPIISKFELSGNNEDVQTFIEGIGKIDFSKY